jgi:hypothetical protein
MNGNANFSIVMRLYQFAPKSIMSLAMHNPTLKTTLHFHLDHIDGIDAQNSAIMALYVIKITRRALSKSRSFILLQSLVTPKIALQLRRP